MDSERVVGPLKNNPNSMQRAAELYDLLQKGNEVDGVVRQVYGKDPSRLTDAEIDEVILILGGLDSCAATSPELKAALTGTIGILRSLLTQKPIPDPKRLGPALCAGEDPFDGKPHRFQPNCGEPSLEGEWVLDRTLQSCRNLPEGCDAKSVKVRFHRCTDTRCVLSRRDGGWKNPHALTRQKSGSWVAKFDDIGVRCEGRLNEASFIIRLAVASTNIVGGIPRATRLIGTYKYEAVTNPPTCPNNAESRSRSRVYAPELPYRPKCARYCSWPVGVYARREVRRMTASTLATAAPHAKGHRRAGRS